jgi:hypothetical protein
MEDPPSVRAAKPARSHPRKRNYAKEMLHTGQHRSEQRRENPMSQSISETVERPASPPSAPLIGSAPGPSYCETCGEWPARPTLNGLRCQLCECRDYAAAHPVPLPRNREMLRDLASIGVPGAAEALLQNH